MTAQSRPWEPAADWQRLNALLVEAHRAQPTSGLYLHVGDLSWRICRTREHGVQLWEGANGELLAFALWYPLGGGVAVDMQVGPSLRSEIEPHMIDWAVQSLGARRDGRSPGVLITSAISTDADRAELLRRRGFQPNGHNALHMVLAPEQRVPIPVPRPGFVIRPVAGSQEFAARAALQPGVHSSRFSVEDYGRLRAAPGYAPELDLVAVAPDGTFAAFCVCWFDPVNGSALIEPLGVDPRFRNRGLGRAIVAEAITRGRALGATSFRACTASGNTAARRLYESLGFHVAAVEVDYTRDCGPIACRGESEAATPAARHLNSPELAGIVRWCRCAVGPCEIAARDSRFDGRSSVLRLRAGSGGYYVKVHRERASWEREVHAYEQWARAFGGLAPKLLAVHAEEPLALLVGELPGATMEHEQLPAAQEEAAWHDAGRALAGLHAFATGEFFGPCKRDGSCAGAFVSDPVEYVSTELDRQTEGAARTGRLNDSVLTTIGAARGQVSAFAGEAPVPCHRDYCPANWLVTSDGVCAGVIDFEMAQWDVRVADFSRYPSWERMRKPHVLERFFEGYGRTLTPKEEQQLLVMDMQYALSAIVWGCEHSYFGFVEEGRQALEHLGKRLGNR